MEREFTSTKYGQVYPETMEQTNIGLLSAAHVTLNSCNGMRRCTSIVTFAQNFLKCWNDLLI